MTTIAQDNYKKGVEKAVERWKVKITVIGGKAKKPREALKALRAIGNPTPADKKKIADLVAELEKLSKEVETATTELKLDIILLGPVDIPKITPPSVLQKLPQWLQDLIKAKGVPLGNGVVLTPDVKFDTSTFKLKYIGIKVKW